jgi:hypothetical protein
MSGWIGVDLDGTLATYGGWKGETHIGEPIVPMMDRVREWVAKGTEVRIMTARVSGLAGRHEADKATISSAIQDWLESHGLPRLAVTCEKDYGMVELWDDRAVTVQMNTGRILTQRP